MINKRGRTTTFLRKRAKPRKLLSEVSARVNPTSAILNTQTAISGDKDVVPISLPGALSMLH